ncbi:RNA/RNP complex-1-interacting phosphatase-like isoform X2 [Scyliorhinus torazame]
MAGPGRRALGLLSVARSGRRLWSRGACVQDQAEAMSKNKIPDRWQKYSAVGLRLPGTRFIAFKVPLKKMFENQLQPGEFFSPTDLLRQIKEQSEELGKIIDLTFTKRYYDPKELPMDLVYEKIFTAGHEVPSGKNIVTFKKAVQSFLSGNMDNDKLVGVHCTHGVNRTGYLICRYLIDVDGMDPRSAIDLFNKSRGHPIERPNYTQDLLQGQDRRPYHRKCPTRNGYREFSQSACPARLSAQSSGQHRKGRRFGTGAVHQTVRHNGNGQPYSSNEYGTEGLSRWSGQLEVLRPSGQPAASQWSGQSEASQRSGQSGVSRWSGQSGASRRSGQSGASQWSGQSGAPQWSGQPEASLWSGQSGASQWSGQSGAPQWSGQSEASQWSGQSEAPQWSGQPEASQWSGQSEASLWSGQSGASQWSGQPQSWQSYQPPQAGRGRRGWNANSGGQGGLNAHRQWDN